jgi:patatin-like phospholipase/acyl hydrolase
MKKIRILSLDGGGIRGILPGIVLTQIEQKLQKKMGDPNVKLSDMFDFMAGTSTGGILA